MIYIIEKLRRYAEWRASARRLDEAMKELEKNPGPTVPDSNFRAKWFDYQQKRYRYTRGLDNDMQKQRAERKRRKKRNP